MPWFMYAFIAVVMLGVIIAIYMPNSSPDETPVAIADTIPPKPAKVVPLTPTQKKAAEAEEARAKRQAIQEEKGRKAEEARQAAIAREMEPKWRLTKTFEGTSIKSTETFEITGDEWRINWETKPGEYGAMNFQVYVYNADGSLKDVAANIIGKGQDSTVVRGAGRYYLQFNTAQPYLVRVEEFR